LINYGLLPPRIDIPKVLDTACLSHYPGRAVFEKSHNPMFSLDDLERTVAERAAASAEKSYTRALLDKGPKGVAKKFGEEAVEFVIAAAGEGIEALRAEAADVLYHFLVVLEARGVKLADVLGELERRTSRTGHEEKASRRK
jgi:phosphoribosyl-ATP pyrophosphohydrolase